MKYIIMCGGDYPKWETPRQLIEINGEPNIARTIRLLGEYTDDISISSNNEIFNIFNVPVLKHDNHYVGYEYNHDKGLWCNAFYFTDEPTTYLFGDVVFSPNAIKTIVEYETDSIMLFGSKAPFAKEYPKWYIEPFAFKVQDPAVLRWAVKETKRLDSIGAFHRRPIAWEFWNVASGGDPNYINPDYVAINDYTCDIDKPDEITNVLNKVNVMAEKKQTRKPRKKIPKAIYKDREFIIMDHVGNKYKITDGTIHFWVKEDDVTVK